MRKSLSLGVAGRVLLLLSFAVLLLQAPVQAEIYKWVDANGTTTFRDTPPPAGVDATAVTLSPLNTYTAPSPRSGDHMAEEPTADSPPPSVHASVDLYTTSWCGYCRRAKAYLTQHGVAFREYDVEKDPAAARRKQQLGGGDGVPFAVINGKTIRGFDPAAYDAALGLR